MILELVGMGADLALWTKLSRYPSAALETLDGMLLVRVACSSCPETEIEVVVETIDDVDLLFCGCDHGYVITAVGEAVPV